MRTGSRCYSDGMITARASPAVTRVEFTGLRSCIGACVTSYVSPNFRCSRGSGGGHTTHSTAWTVLSSAGGRWCVCGGCQDQGRTVDVPGQRSSHGSARQCVLTRPQSNGDPALHNLQGGRSMHIIRSIINGLMRQRAGLVASWAARSALCLHRAISHPCQPCRVVQPHFWRQAAGRMMVMPASAGWPACPEATGWRAAADDDESFLRGCCMRRWELDATHTRPSQSRRLPGCCPKALTPVVQQPRPPHSPEAWRQLATFTCNAMHLPAPPIPSSPARPATRSRETEVWPPFALCRLWSARSHSFPARARCSLEQPFDEGRPASTSDRSMPAREASATLLHTAGCHLMPHSTCWRALSCPACGCRCLWGPSSLRLVNFEIRR